jgi:hypothetical protein
MFPDIMITKYYDPSGQPAAKAGVESPAESGCVKYFVPIT